MKIFVHEPVINGDRVDASYEAGDLVYTHGFILPSQVEKNDPVAVRLTRWLVLIHVLYLFSIEYFTEVETAFTMNEHEVNFFEKIIFNGMAEFRYVNHIPIDTHTTVFGATRAAYETDVPGRKELNGRLLLNGGGKDGIVSGLLLEKSGIDFDFFQIGTGVAQSRVVSLFKRGQHVMRREMDERRFNGRYTGHRPTSAAIAISAVLSAYVSGKRDVLSSNESSANETTLEFEGVSVNHQYSKSFEFESDFNSLLKSHGIPVRYFSLLRPLHELQIAKILTVRPDIATSFISCNSGFRKGFWCLKCAKCAFISLILTAHSPEMAAAALGPDSINSPALFAHLRGLLLETELKPFECVGTAEECAAAAWLILQNGSVQLSPEVNAALRDSAAKVSADRVGRLLKTIDTSAHHIPLPEYQEVLSSMESILSD